MLEHMILPVSPHSFSGPIPAHPSALLQLSLLEKGPSSDALESGSSTVSPCHPRYHPYQSAYPSPVPTSICLPTNEAALWGEDPNSLVHHSTANTKSTVAVVFFGDRSKKSLWKERRKEGKEGRREGGNEFIVC